MANLRAYEKEKFFHFLLNFCHKVSIRNPELSDAIRAIREQAKREFEAGSLFAIERGEKMWNKYLAPFKEIAKKLRVEVKGTPEARIKEQLKTYLSMEKSRKRANTAVLQK